MDPQPPETLTEPEQLRCKTVRAHCPELDALTRHVRSFAVMLTERQGEGLPHWLNAVRKNGLPSLHTLPQASTATSTPSSPDWPGRRRSGQPPRRLPPPGDSPCPGTQAPSKDT
ncbi:hypothetical protein ABZT02_43665 [Streptomyces sp. NPDC005402]|uniref:hypothetical protein n=1 Tax=Streptomyces sp. NPDC005402 TaxID=3155338 RepID=UPI0033A326BC